MSTEPKKILVDIDVLSRALSDTSNVTQEEKRALREAIERARKTR